MPKSTKEATVRMYNVGFGDCFLLTLTDGKNTFRALVDCGVHGQGHSKNNMKDVVKHIKDTTNNSIDLVVCTHRHQDHVSGFNDQQWDDVAVSEVWMPWTEHPTDPLAVKIRTAQSSLALALQKKLAPNSIVSHLALNNLTNEAAMKTLHRGFSGSPKRKFLSEKDKVVDFDDVFPGLKIHVLGPSKSPDVIKNMDPPSGKGYLNLVEAITGAEYPAKPFGDAFVVDRSDARLMNSDGIWNHLNFPIKPQSHSDTELSVAAALEKAVNNTSLMLIFEFGDAFLLFSGDAQWGTWNEVLQDSERCELLTRVCFYKVGHHGSHNATPKEYVEKYVDKNTLAMISTRHMDNWPRIPKAELVTALDEKSLSVAQSDKLTKASDYFQKEKDLYTETTLTC